MSKENGIILFFIIVLLISSHFIKIVNDKNEEIITIKESAKKNNEIYKKASLKRTLKIKELEKIIKEKEEKLRKEKLLLEMKRKVSLPKDLIPIEIQKAECLSPNKITKDMEIVIVSGDNGKRLPESIDLSGDNTNLMDVYIDNYEKEIVLILSGYNPTIWNIYKTKETKINQVVLTGYNKQLIKGLSSETQILYRDRKNIQDSSCIYLSRLQTEKEEKSDPSYKQRRTSKTTANMFSNELFGRDVDKRVFSTKNGVTLIGNENSYNKDYYQNEHIKIEDLYLEDRLLSGPDGLNQLLEREKIKDLSLIEFEKILNQLNNQQQKLENDDYLEEDLMHRNMLLEEVKRGSLKVYLVIDEMRFPSGLSAMHIFPNNKYRDYLFIIDNGVPAPTGSEGHAIIINLND